MVKKVVTDGRVRESLHGQFKQFLDGENLSEKIVKNIENHGIKKGRVIEVYQYLDKSLVRLNDGKEVEAWHLHRCMGSVIDLYTPNGEQRISDKKHEPCILPRYELKALVAEVGKDEYVLLGYYNPNMVGSFSPADRGHYLIKTMTDGYQAGLDISPNNISIISHEGASFIEADVNEDTEINYAEIKDTYTKDEVDDALSHVYDKTYVDNALQEIWDYIDPQEEEEEVENNG